MLFDIRQKILIMETDGSGLRSKAHGWTLECGQAAEQSAMNRVLQEMLTKEMTINEVEVGMMRSPNEFHSFKTPLHAMAAGWRVLNRPTKHKVYPDCNTCADAGDPKTVYEWWFEKISSATDPQWNDIPGDM